MGFRQRFSSPDVFVSFRLIISPQALQSRERIRSLKQSAGCDFARCGVMPAGPELLPRRAWVSQMPCASP